MFRNVQTILILSLSFFLSVSTLANQKQPRIIGGKDTVIQEVPWQVALLRSDSPERFFRDQYCGAVIIHEKWLLSAAHCFDGTQSGFGFAAIGLSNLGRPFEAVQVIDVKRVIMNEKYNAFEGTFNNDIALLELAEDIDFSACGDSCAKIDLLQADEEQTLMPFTTPVLISGWGATFTSANFEIYPEQLQSAQVFTENCFESNRPASFYTDNMICAHGNAKDTCVGDSGGPLAVQNSLGGYSVAGLTSWGSNPCAQPGEPGVYTRVANYTCWVEKNSNGDVKSANDCDLDDQAREDCTIFSNDVDCTSPIDIASSSSGALNSDGFVFIILTTLTVLRSRKRNM